MDKEMLQIRHVMLKQEGAFRDQVRELHRLYQVQKSLMEDAKRRQELTGYSAAPFGSTQAASAMDSLGTTTTTTTTTTTRRRTFDLELPAEEYMDVDEEQERTPAKSLPPPTAPPPALAPASSVPPLHPSLPSYPSLSSAGSGSLAPLADTGFLGSAPPSLNLLGSSRIRESDVEFLHMMKRPRTAEDFIRQIPHSPAASTAAGQALLGGLWSYAMDTKSKPSNGYHLDDKGSVFLKSDLYHHQPAPPTQQQQQHQHVVFLDSQGRLQQGAEMKPVDSGFNPLFSVDRASPYAFAGATHQASSLVAAAAAAAAAASRLPNHVGYTSQGILLPSAPSLPRRDSFPESAFWWKSSSNYYQPNQPSQQHQQQQPQQHQYHQQLAVLQPPSAPQPAASQVPWQLASNSYQPISSYPAAGGSAGSLACFKEEASTPSWLKANVNSPAYHQYSAAAKPPFKKPPKLILDGATMELKLAPLDSRNQLEQQQQQQQQMRCLGDSGLSETGSEKMMDLSRNHMSGSGISVRMIDIEKPPAMEETSTPSLLCAERSLEKQESSSRIGGPPEGQTGEHCPTMAQPAPPAGVPDEQSKQELKTEDDKKRAGVSSPTTVSKEEDKGTASSACKGVEPVVEVGAKLAEENTAAAENGGGKKRRFKLVSSRDLAATAGEAESTKNVEPEEGKQEPGLLDGRKENGESDRKRRKSSNHQQQQQQQQQQRKTSRDRDRSSSDHAAKDSDRKKSPEPSAAAAEVILDSLDDGANLAAEILVSLAPAAKLVVTQTHQAAASAERDGGGGGVAAAGGGGRESVVVSRHKSKRRSIDTLSPGIATTSQQQTCSTTTTATPSSKHHSGHHHHHHHQQQQQQNEANHSSKQQQQQQQKKKKLKQQHHKNGKVKYQVEDDDEEPPAAPPPPPPPPPPPSSFKSVKVSLKQQQQSEHPAEKSSKSSGKLKKTKQPTTTATTAMTTLSSSSGKKQHLHQAATTSSTSKPSTTAPRASKSSSPAPGAAKVTTVNLVISKNREGGVYHHHHHHHYHHHPLQQQQQQLKKNSSTNSNKSSYCSEQESLDRLSQPQQQSTGNSSEEMMTTGGKDSDEVEDSSWSRRSWGPSTRRKRMRRNKRTAGL